MCGQNLPVRTGLGGSAFAAGYALAVSGERAGRERHGEQQWRAQPRMEEHKAQYRAAALRDQSEDRPAPKFLVIYWEAHEGYHAGWWVIRAADQKPWDGPVSAKEAVATAIKREEQYA